MAKSNSKPVMFYQSNIRFLRKKYDFTQEDMADLLGFKNKSSYCLIENRTSGISIENLVKISDFFGITLDQLVKQDMSKENG